MGESSLKWPGNKKRSKSINIELGYSASSKSSFVFAPPRGAVGCTRRFVSTAAPHGGIKTKLSFEAKL